MEKPQKTPWATADHALTGKLYTNQNTMLPCPQCKQHQAQIQQQPDTNKSHQKKIVYCHACQFTCWLKHYQAKLKQNTN